MVHRLGAVLHQLMGQSPWIGRNPLRTSPRKRIRRKAIYRPRHNLPSDCPSPHRKLICKPGNPSKEPATNHEREAAREALSKIYPNFSSLSAEDRQKAREEYNEIRRKYPQKLATVADAVDHIDHIVKTIGIDHVGIGTDFDGEESPLSGGPGPSRTDEEIQIVFDRYKAALYRIYNRELRKNPTLQGKMVLRITIEPDGKVSASAVDSSDMDSPDLDKKIAARVRKFNFGAKEGVPAITILYPIDFLPAS